MTPPSQRTESQQTIALLTEQLRRGGVTDSAALGPILLRSTGLPPLDELLPERGLPPGSLVECLTDGPGSGAGTLVFTALARALEPREHCVVVDGPRRFYPGAVPPDLVERLLVIHPAGERDLLWALEQSLRCRGVSAVVGWVDRLTGAAYRRLKLAAEVGGGVGWLLRPVQRLTQPSWADIRWHVRPRLPPEPGAAVGSAFSAGRAVGISATETGLPAMPFPAGRWLRIELLYCRGRLGERAADLEIDDDTGAVRLVPPLACATVLPGAVPRRAVRA